MRNKLIGSLAVASGLLLAATATVSAEPIKVHGSSTVFGTVMSPHHTDIERDSGLQLSLLSNGSGQGVKDLIDGQAEVAMISAPLPEIMDKIAVDGPGSLIRRNLVAHPIGDTRVAFAVNRVNPVRELSYEQVIDILSGRITNWRELGGFDAPIQIIVELRGGGVRAILEQRLETAGEVFAPSSTTVQTAAMAAFAVNQLPHALGITTDAAIGIHSTERIKVDTAIEQPMFLVTVGQPTGKTQKLIDSVRKIGKG